MAGHEQLAASLVLSSSLCCDRASWPMEMATRRREIVILAKFDSLSRLTERTDFEALAAESSLSSAFPEALSRETGYAPRV